MNCCFPLLEKTNPFSSNFLNNCPPIFLLSIASNSCLETGSQLPKSFSSSVLPFAVSWAKKRFKHKFLDKKITSAKQAKKPLNTNSWTTESPLPRKQKAPETQILGHGIVTRCPAAKQGSSCRNSAQAVCCPRLSLHAIQSLPCRRLALFSHCTRLETRLPFHAAIALGKRIGLSQLPQFFSFCQFLFDRFESTPFHLLWVRSALLISSFLIRSVFLLSAAFTL